MNAIFFNKATKLEKNINKFLRTTKKAEKLQ